MNVVVHTFYSESYTPLSDITTVELYEYCRKHKYDLFIEKIPNGNVDFVKTKKARELLDKYDLVWAVENDILITNHNIKIESFIDDEHDFFICKDVNNVNGGSFIVKNTEIGKWWLDETNKAAKNYTTEQNFWELLGHTKVKYLEHPSINSIPYEYYAPSYGYINWEQYEPIKEKPTHKMGCWEVGDFVCHLPGKPLNERIEIFNQIKEHIIL